MQQVPQRNLSDIIINSSLSGIFSFDINHKINIWNSSCGRIFGVKASEVLDLEVENVSFFQHNRHFLTHFYRVLKGESFSAIERFEALEGKSNGVIEMGLTPLRGDNDEVIGGVASIIELTREMNANEERNKALEESKKADRKLSSLISSLPGIFYECNNDFKWTMNYISDGCYPITGYNKELFLSGLLNIGDIILPEYKTKIWEKVQAALKEKKAFQLEYKIKTSTGSEKWVWEQGHGIYNEDGDLMVIEGFITDISSRKEYDEKLLKSEERFRLFFEKSPLAMAISREGVILQVNLSFLNLFGYSESSEVMGKNVLNYIAPSLREDITQKIQKRINGEKVPTSYETIGIRKDESEFPFYLEVGYFELHDGRATMHIIKDITESKEAERKVAESVVKFKTLFESQLMGITINDTEGKIIEANKAFIEMLGYKPSEIESNSLDWRKITPPEYFERDSESVVEAVQTGMIKPFEKEYFRKDGSRLPVLVGASTFGKTGTGVTFVIDISQLKQSRIQLEAINKELNTFLYMASHDLKGPISSVKGLTEIAQSESKDPVALKYLNLINRSIIKLDKSLMNLMKVMRLKEETINKDEINFAFLLEDIKENLNKLDGFEKVKFSQKINIKSSFYGNLGIVNSVLQNLVENAVKYQSSVNGDPLVEVRINESSDLVLIEVEDNGRGIDPAIKSRVFDMFYRGTIDSKGSGLGLYIVKNAVEKIGGKIDFRPGDLGGTIFSVSFPK